MTPSWASTPCPAHPSSFLRTTATPRTATSCASSTATSSARRACECLPSPPLAGVAQPCPAGLGPMGSRVRPGNHPMSAAYLVPFPLPCSPHLIHPPCDQSAMSDHFRASPSVLFANASATGRRTSPSSTRRPRSRPRRHPARPPTCTRRAAPTPHRSP